MLPSLLALLLTAATAAQTVTTTLEEIESIPEGGRGQWTIGGKEYLVNSRTAVTAEPVVGNLALIAWAEVAGKAMAVEVRPLAFGPGDVDDGPYVAWRSATEAEIVNFSKGVVTRETRTVTDGPLTIPPAAPGRPEIVLDAVPPSVESFAYAMPERLLAISDLEGNEQAFRGYLEATGVTDASGHWSWGSGHLVLIGDIVDRGENVTELLWHIRQLEREARAAGGHVHYIIGNHEAMVMAGDLRYVHPKYDFVCGRIGESYDALFGPQTELGRWLRTRNAVVRIGRYLFVHAGYSPQLDRLQLDATEVNERVRRALGPPKWPADRTLSDHLGWHSHGPLWYRGYFDRHADEWGGRATDAELRAILERHEADHIVVGHTVVPDVGWLDPAHRVIATDVKWADPGEAEGLLVVDGQPWRLLPGGERLPLPVLQPAAASNSEGR